MPTNYTQLFQQRIGRAPTREDITKVNEKLLILSNARALPPDQDEENLESSFRAMKEAYSVNDTDLETILSVLAEEENKKGNQKLRRRKSIAIMTLTGVLAGLIGTGTGIGLAVYNAFQEPAVRTIIKHYQTKERDLENKFFGPLDALTSISTRTTLTPSEQQRYIEVHLGVDVDRIGNIIYDNTIKGVRIVARHVVANDFLFNDHDLVIIKYDSLGNIAAAYDFQAVSEDSFHKLLKQNEAMVIYSKTILLNGQTATIVDHKKKTITSFENNAPKYNAPHKEAMELYKSDALRVLEDFRVLLQRGPNAE